MKPTSPDQAGAMGPGFTQPENRPGQEPPTVDQPRPGDATSPDRLDEAVGEQLDRHLESLRSGTTPPAADPQLAPHLEPLRPVVDRLYSLAQELSSPGEFPSTRDRPDTVDTRDRPGATDSTRSARRPNVPASEPGLGEPAATGIGKYQVVRKLGGGGQAGAYLAFDPDLRRHVVIKLYHEAQTEHEQEVILREGRALARVRSPYVAQCHSAERHEGVPYLVVEYIPGKNLAEAQRRRPLPLDRAVELVGRVAEGLAAVHACGLLHRDIKPANILVGDDGTPRLVDFGLAVPLAGESLRGVSGTLAYMAPEQARGETERIDPRSDVFGLGAVLYDLLTGRPPYRADSQEALWNAAREGDVTPPRRHNPKLPASVNDLCLRCLAKSPTQRFASAAELVQAIRRWQRFRRWTGQELAERRGWPRLVPLVAAAVALLVLLPLGIYFLTANRDSDRPDQLVDRGQTPGGSRRQPTDNKPTDPPRRQKPIERVPVQNPPQEKQKIRATPRPPDGGDPRRDFPIQVELLKKVDGKAKEFQQWPVNHKGVYLIEDKAHVWIRIKLDRSAYVGIWYVDSENQFVQLFPNKRQADNWLSRRQPLTVPGEEEEDDDYAIEAYVNKTQRADYLYVLAATEPWKPPVVLRRGGKDDVWAEVEGEELASLVGKTRGFRLKSKEMRMSEMIVPFRVSPGKEE
jgi:serine/threonine-protein kinase